MGRGTPCPIPAGKREAVRSRITALQNRGCLSLEETALKLQDIWPGCTANHVRGHIAGVRSGQGQPPLMPKKAEPWRPGDPKPEAR